MHTTPVFAANTPLLSATVVPKASAPIKLTIPILKKTNPAKVPHVRQGDS